jgi:hypothetical protein
MWFAVVLAQHDAAQGDPVRSYSPLSVSIAVLSWADTS